MSSLHLPLLPSTQGLIGVDALALMKPDAVLINAARGGIVDEGALARHLEAGRIAGVAAAFESRPLRHAAHIGRAWLTVYMTRLEV
ncbi:MAG: NAD(P)-dependent oxidoreductase, partial [Casimicrobiaceae bacterium]